MGREVEVEGQTAIPSLGCAASRFCCHISSITARTRLRDRARAAFTKETCPPWRSADPTLPERDEASAVPTRTYSRDSCLCKTHAQDLTTELQAPEEDGICCLQLQVPFAPRTDGHALEQPPSAATKEEMQYIRHLVAFLTDTSGRVSREQQRLRARREPVLSLRGSLCVTLPRGPWIKRPSAGLK